MGYMSFLCAAALASAFPSLTFGQIQTFGGIDAERTASTVVMIGKDVAAGVSISFTGGKWKPEYDQLDALLDSMKGTNQRLGKNWWTTLDTSVPIAIGGTNVPAGAYFLGLHIDANRDIHLLVIDAGRAMQRGWMPFAPAAWRADLKAPLTLNRNTLAESRETMAIELAVDKKDPTCRSGALAIRWGRHELTAPVTFRVDGKAEQAIVKATTDVQTIAQAAKLFRIKNNRVPTIEDLTTPDEKGHAYLDPDSVAKDPWGNDYFIKEGDRPGTFVVVSRGPNGSEGDDDDITSRPRAPAPGTGR